MKTWLFVGSLAAGVLLFVYEWYCNREQPYEEGQHGTHGRTFSEEDYIEINETNPMELEKRLGSRAKLPGTTDLCSICLDNLIRKDTGEPYCIIALPQCGHWFHQRCALRLLEYHPQCPVCRIDIDSSALRGTPVRLNFESYSETGDNSSTETPSNRASSSTSNRQRGQTTMEGASNSTIQATKGSDVKRPDKVYPYRLNFWADIISEDSTSEIMNVLGIMFSMIGILLKYKTCAWFGVLVAAVSYANVRSNHDGKQIMSTFLLSISAVVMCYLINPAPISHYLGQQQQEQQAQPAA